MEHVVLLGRHTQLGFLGSASKPHFSSVWSSLLWHLLL
uniref:Transmembrane protein 184B n=1 Tax=Cherax quadricarinatus TaxID=27406 RepID=G0ZJ51_CHEQU|nr:transmembrane protein 184B [Cherax quadricarinatus]